MSSKNPRITADEIETIKKAQGGDKAAFAKLFKRYKSFVDHVLYNYIQDMDEAKDITNIVFLKVHDKLHTFTEYESFGGWLRVIANRTAIDYLRKIKDKEVFGVNTERLTEDTQIAQNESELVDRMTYERLLNEFKKLPEVHKRVCLLFYQDNLTIPQIADILRVPTGTVKSILSRTRKKLQNKTKNQL